MTKIRKIRSQGGSILRNTLLNILSFYSQVSSKGVFHENCLILPPHGPGSLGDEAIVFCAISLLRSRGVHRLGIIELDPNHYWSDQVDVDATIDMSEYFGVGGIRQELKFLTRFAPFQTLFFLGTDVIDGYYSAARSVRRIRLLELAALAGRQSILANFSLNANPANETIVALKDLPENIIFRSRDPLSCLRSQRILDRDIELTSDLAFTLKSDDSTTLVGEISRWIFQERENGQIVIGVNFNSLFVQGAGNTRDGLIESKCSQLLELLFIHIPNLSLVLLAHDFREESSDLDLLETIKTALPAKQHKHVLLPMKRYSAAEVKAICGHLEFVISGRMHLAIASLGQGVPVLCMSYQDKMEGLLQHFGLSDMTFELDQNLKVEKAAAWISNKIMERKELKATILHMLPHVVTLAEKNMEMPVRVGVEQDLIR